MYKKAISIVSLLVLYGINTNKQLYLKWILKIYNTCSHILFSFLELEIRRLAYEQNYRLHQTQKDQNQKNQSSTPLHKLLLTAQRLADHKDYLNLKESDCDRFWSKYIFFKIDYIIFFQLTWMHSFTASFTKHLNTVGL